MHTTLVVTSIHPPNPAMRELAAGCAANGWEFIVTGDSKSPPGFSLEGSRFLSLESQVRSGFTLGEKCPECTYSRKNIGYLFAMQSGADVIVETDDDNHPKPGFWERRKLVMQCRPVERDGWVNAYRYFSDDFIYPRGLPLNEARNMVPEVGEPDGISCPIQQGLADSDPDVDAVYRMLFPLPFHFEVPHDPVLLRNGSWCPFNSQNTTFFEAAFPLLYLPTKCSFRMTDIWRSFVAQRVLQSLDLGVLFHGPTVWQERNTHDLHKDFIDELPGYVNNTTIRERLTELSFSPDSSMEIMVESCYQTLIREAWIGQEEEILLQSWFSDLKSLGRI